MYLKTLLFFGAIFNLAIQCGFSQVVSSEKFGFKSHRIQSKKLGEVNYYVTINKSAQQKPMLLYVDGSGSLPLFHLMERGMAGQFHSITKNYQSISILCSSANPEFPLRTVSEEILNTVILCILNLRNTTKDCR